MRKLTLFIFVAVSIFMGIGAHADDTDLFIAPVKPNILIIVDNSNSMDEDFYGNAVGSFASTSKSVTGKKALRTIVNSYRARMRIGLMSYKLSGVGAQYLHNLAEFISYD